jgi:hypothetical protein
MSSRYNKIELSKKHHRSSKGRAVRTSYKGRAVRTSSKGTRCPHEACRSCDRKESDRLRQSAQPGGTCSRDRIYFSQTVIHLGWRRWLLGGGCQPTALPGRNRTLQRRRRSTHRQRRLPRNLFTARWRRRPKATARCATAIRSRPSAATRTRSSSMRWRCSRSARSGRRRPAGQVANRRSPACAPP